MLCALNCLTGDFSFHEVWIFLILFALSQKFSENFSKKVHCIVVWEAEEKDHGEEKETTEKLGGRRKKRSKGWRLIRVRG